MEFSILETLLNLIFLGDIGEEILKIIQGTGLDTSAFVSSINNVIVPMAISLVTIFWCIELFETITRLDQRDTIWQNVIMLAVKLLLAKTIITFAPILLEAIVEIGDDLISSIGVVGEEITSSNVSELINEIKDMKLTQQIMVYFTLIPLSIIGTLTALGVKIAIYGRILKLILLQVFSPIAMSTLPFERYNTMGKNFIKSFLGTVLQGAMIVVLLLLVQQIGKTGLINMGNDDKSIIGVLISTIMVNCILLFALFKSESWAKEVAGLG